jgi:hypothetical protein
LIFSAILIFLAPIFFFFYDLNFQNISLDLL